MAVAAAAPAPAFAQRFYLGVAGATLLTFVAVGAVLPILPRYVQGPLGAGDLAVGVVVGAYTFSALVSRPLAGWAADRRGRRVTFVCGVLLVALGGALYALPAGVTGLVVARLVLGFGEGTAITAASAWVVDVAPLERRGQVIGLFGLGIWGGLSLGPAVGEGLLALAGYGGVWAFAALAPVASAALAARLPDRYEPGPPRRGGALLPRAAVRPGLAIGLGSVGYAAVAGFVVLHLAAQGEGGGTLVLMAFSVTVVAVRVVAGRLPDRLGPVPCALAAGASEALGLALLALAHSLALALLGAALMGAGFALLYPALVLLVLDRVDEHARGAALGAFSAFFDAGVGLGAPLAGAVASVAGYAGAFWVGAACAALGTLVVLLGATRGVVVGRATPAPRPPAAPPR